MSAREWMTTPWWEQRLLIEGLEKEGIFGRDEPGTEGALRAERVHQDGGTTITERDYSYDLSEMDEMPESGFSVGTLG